MAENAQVDVKKLSFERAIEELESIVKRLEEGRVPLEESIAIYERGEALKRRCEELLRQAEARVEKITTDASGKAVGVEPLGVQGAWRRGHRPLAGTLRKANEPENDNLCAGSSSGRTSCRDGEHAYDFRMIVRGPM